MIKVLIVDDSSLMRMMISKMLDSDGNIEVIGEASDGLLGLEKVKDMVPDIVILDIEMPRMNGLEFLEGLKVLAVEGGVSEGEVPTVIVLSGLGVDNPKIVMESLKLGAKDFIMKPNGSVSLGIEEVRGELISRVKFFYWERNKSIGHLSSLNSREYGSGLGLDFGGGVLEGGGLLNKISSLVSVELIGIGVSTGGPFALRQILPGFRRDYPIPIIVVQHMPVEFTGEFANSLNSVCELEVKEAEEGEYVECGKVYIAPGDKNLRVVKDSGGSIRISLEGFDVLGGVGMPSVELFFDSMGESIGKHNIGLMMTGMGSDGVEGIRKLRLCGGYTIAQSERSCTVYGMPRVAIERGGIDEVLDLEEIPMRLKEVAKHLYGYE